VAGRGQVQVRALFGGGKEGEGGGNPFGNMGNMMEQIKKAQALVAEETANVQKELGATEFEGFDDDETVRVVFNGNQEPLQVDITDDAYAAGSDELEKRLTAAMREAHGKSVDGMKERMKVLAQKLGLPQPPQ